MGKKETVEKRILKKKSADEFRRSFFGCPVHNEHASGKVEKKKREGHHPK
ncbi:MAG: hypothetical protein Q7S14_00425 [bacterium]|nr:hypothetical protein [bacterium]